MSASPLPQPPTGRVAFVFTDVVNSTALWVADSKSMADSLELHDSILREVFETAGGYVFTTAGDSFSVAFQTSAAAVEACQLVQARLAEATWPGPTLAVRVGIHCDVAVERDGDYFGSAVSTAARIEAAGHGGQILLSDAVLADLDTPTTNLGRYELRGLDEPISIHQIGSETFPPLRVPSPGVVRIPAPPSSFIGREPEIREVRARLETRRVVTLTGAGGSGKTRLATEVAERAIPHFADGVSFADLSTIDDPGSVDDLVARSIGLTVSDGEDPRVNIASFLADRQHLLVIDNCEHVIDGAADLVDEIVSRRSESKVLATSREALDCEGETVFQVPSLAVRVDRHQASPALGPAVDLFTERSIDAGAVLGADAATRATIADICEALDGMPLAIELAAARTVTLPPDQLLARLNDRFALLGRRRRGRGRQRTLETTIAWSYQLLDEDEQQCLRACGIFVGSFDLESVAAILDIDGHEALELVDSLIAKSLMQPALDDPTSPILITGRYRMLETIRAFAEDRLADQDETMDLRDRFAAFLGRRYDVLGPNWLLSTLPGHLEHDSLISAYEHAVNRGDTELAERLAAGICGNAGRVIFSSIPNEVLRSPHVAPATPYGLLATYSVGADALGFGDRERAAETMRTLDAIGGEAAMAARMLEVFLAGRQEPDRSRAALSALDQIDISTLAPGWALQLRQVRLHGHVLHGDMDWLMAEPSSDAARAVPMFAPIASTIVAASAVLERFVTELEPHPAVMQGRSYLRTMYLALGGDFDAIKAETRGVRIELTRNRQSALALPMHMSCVALAWCLDDHDLARRMLIDGGEASAHGAAVLFQVARLVGCEAEMLETPASPASMRALGQVVLGHLDELDATIQSAAR